jgi:thymidine phosphorylase
MDRVLGRTAGNALEVRESIEVLTGAGGADDRLVEVTLALARTVLDQGGLGDADPAEALRSGAAAERFAAMAAALGGPADLLERPGDHLAAAPVVLPVEPARAGVVTAHATRDLGLVVTELGGNRHVETDSIDHAVGLDAIAAPGERVGPGEKPLAVVHARDDASAQAAAAAVRAAIAVGDSAPPVPPIVTEELR